MVAVLAELYNVTPRASEDGKSITLGLPSKPSITRLEQIPTAIDRLLPATLKRLCEAWKNHGYAGLYRSIPAEYKDAKGNPLPTAHIRTNDKTQIAKGLEAMRKEAIRQLSIRLEPMIAAKADNIVVWEELYADSKWLMQFILCIEAIPMAYGYTQNGMPDSLSQFEKDRAYAEIYPDQGRTWLRVKLLTPNRMQGVTRTGVISKP